MTLFTLASSPAGLVFRVSLLFFSLVLGGERDANFFPLLQSIASPRGRIYPPRNRVALCAGACVIVARHRSAPGEARMGEVQGAVRARRKRQREKRESAKRWFRTAARPDGTCASTPLPFFFASSSKLSSFVCPSFRTSSAGTHFLLARPPCAWNASFYRTFCRPRRLSFFFSPSSSSSFSLFSLSHHRKKY